MPQGIGPIGIYHSHPFSSEIFHSHTDDATLLSLSNQFPNCISIVTNGKEINYYQRGKNKKTNEIFAKFSSPKIIKFFNISFTEVFHLKINNDLLKGKDERKKLNIKLFNSLSTYLNNIWDDLEYFDYGRNNIKDDLIKPYLTNNIEGKSIQIRIPEKFKENGNNQLQFNKVKEEYNNYSLFKFKIKVTIPIYSANESETFSNFNNIIKTELLSNNIVQKIFNCVIDDTKGRIILPDDYYINFFGFYIRLLCFKIKRLNRNKLSSENYEVILKLVSLFENFKNMKLNYTIKRHLLLSIIDIKKLAKKFEWEDQINKQIRKLKKYFNFF